MTLSQSIVINKLSINVKPELSSKGEVIYEALQKIELRILKSAPKLYETLLKSEKYPPIINNFNDD